MKISIWGSTGTIGTKALDIALKLGFDIVAIVAGANANLLIEQGRRVKPKYIGVSNPTAFSEVKSALENLDIEVLPDSEFENLSKTEVDCCVMAISGNDGLIPSFSCLGHTKRLAIATKEVIISGGEFFRTMACKNGTEIIPIDSEHNAIFQCIKGESKDSIKEIVLTASGGPFIDLEESELKTVTIESALKHPNWSMGKKITIDSATFINKALEIIEAAYLFEVSIDKIKALIHPNSIIHGLVRFCDNSFKAALAFPDMIFPISYAINYPQRLPCNLPDLNFEKLQNLNFKKPKSWQLRNVNLAYQAYKEGKVIAFNRANEKAVQLFLDGKIKFDDIYPTIVTRLERAQYEKITSLDDIIEIISSFS